MKNRFIYVLVVLSVLYFFEVNCIPKLNLGIRNGQVEVTFSLPANNYRGYRIKQFTTPSETNTNEPLTRLIGILQPEAATGTLPISAPECVPNAISLIQPSGREWRELVFIKHRQNMTKVKIAIHDATADSIQIKVTNHDSCLTNQYHALINCAEYVSYVQPVESGTVLTFDRDLSPCLPCRLTIIVPYALPRIIPSDTLEFWFDQMTLMVSHDRNVITADWTLSNWSANRYRIHLIAHFLTTADQTVVSNEPLNGKNGTMEFRTPHCGLHQVMLLKDEIIRKTAAIYIPIEQTQVTFNIARVNGAESIMLDMSRNDRCAQNTYEMRLESASSPDQPIIQRFSGTNFTLVDVGRCHPCSLTVSAPLAKGLIQPSRTKFVCFGPGLTMADLETSICRTNE